MKNTFTHIALTSVLALALSPLAALAADRPSVAGTASSTNAQALCTQLQQRGEKEIANRIAALNALSARIGEMKHLSASQISALQASIASEVSTLQALNTKLMADTDCATIRADVQSITKAYRVYALVMPQAQIDATADRILTIVGQLQALSTKLQARITAAASTTDVTALNAAMSDFNAKVADAAAQANAAIAEVAGLTPDNGDKAKFDANLATLKDARSKIKAAMEDLQAARKDAQTIAQGVRGKGEHTASTTESH